MRRKANEDAMALPMVLLMITVVGVVVVALLGLATTTAFSSVVVKNTADRTFAAHGGIDAAMQQIRAGATFCNDGSTLPLKVNNRVVLVSCARTSDSFDLGVGGWAVYVNSAATGGGIDTSNAVNADKVITGPVFNGGSWNAGASLIVKSGQVLTAATSCGTFNPAKVTTSPIANFTACVGGASTAPAVEPVLPTAPPLPTSMTDAPGWELTGSGKNACRTFSPGRYSSASQFALAPNMYFKSGVYFLDNVGEVVFGKDRTAVAGQPSPIDTPVLTGCASEAPTKLGALFVLGGNSRITVENGGRFEVHAYVPSATSTTPPVAIRTVGPSDTTLGWLTGKQSTLSTTSNALSFSDNKSILALHGAVYTPLAAVSIDPRGSGASASITAGLVVGKFTLTAPAAIGSDKLSISSGTASGSRRWSIVAEATDRVVTCERTDPGCTWPTKTNDEIRKIKAFATLLVSGTNDLGIESWRIGS